MAPFTTPEVLTDCRHYNGYKPCGFGENCDGCPHYDPCGKRILIIKLGAAGDVIRTTPILGSLRDADKDCHVTWITDPISVDLLAQTGSIDRLLPYSAENCMVLQSQKFELLINFEKEPRALALAELVSAERKLGFAPGRNGKAYIYNSESLYALRLGLSDELKFRTNRKSYPRIIHEMIGLDYDGQDYDVGLSDEAQRLGAEFALQHDLDPAVPVVGLNTGCGEVFQTKQWTFEGFLELIDYLRERGDCRIVLLGGPREVQLNAELLDRAGPGVVDSGCDNTIEQFMGIIGHCDLVLSADTMAMHIAIGLRKEIVALFGSTCHQEVDLFGRGEKIITDFPCSPCYLKTCPEEHTCMQALQAPTVAEAISRRLQALRAAKG